ncbi:MAG TPA: aspartate--tRNA ligase [Bacillota bacterium]
MSSWIRTEYCGELRSTDLGKKVCLNGWVHRQRNLGGVIFLDLRDRSGLVQVVVNPEQKEAYAIAETLRSEFVIMVKGMVSRRPEGSLNKDLLTGEVEVLAEELVILNSAKTPPIYVDDSHERTANVDETVRLKYRYLDLRRPAMQKNLILRHRVTKTVRDFLDEKGFIEVETPILMKSTPEGARDYLVPSRVNPGKFYALPQSPQLFKQLLMVGGLEKYFQIAKCFRDEDLRADRQPEFTQIDLEMSFIDQEVIFNLLEEMMVRLFREILGVELERPFPRLEYSAAMERYGSDKPDLRYGMELIDISSIVEDSDFSVFRNVIANQGIVVAITAPGCSAYSRKELDGLSQLAMKYGAKGLAHLALKDGQVKSPIAKFFTPQQLTAITKKVQAQEGDLVLIVAGEPTVARTALGALRQEMAARLGLIPEGEYKFLWVVNFPLFEFDQEAGRYVAVHHAFTSPLAEDIPLLKEEPGKVRANAYDLVLNGMELGSGSIRIHLRAVQEEIFRIMGLSEAEAKEKFGFLLEAFEYGTPPHGGIALGLDRLVMILTGAANMREVIAFPKTTSATCLMTGTPSEVDPEQLQEVHIKSVVNRKTLLE